jgi:hypothetical protein
VAVTGEMGDVLAESAVVTMNRPRAEGRTQMKAREISGAGVLSSRELAWTRSSASGQREER